MTQVWFILIMQHRGLCRTSVEYMDPTTRRQLLRVARRGRAEQEEKIVAQTQSPLRDDER